MKFNLLFAASLLAGLMTGCGGGGSNAVTTVPTAHLEITLPGGSATAGTPFTFTVTARDASNAVVATYAGTVQISTSDQSATLPANSMLKQGTGTFDVTFNTDGSHTISASDIAENAIATTSGAVTVNPAPPPSPGMAFVTPASVILPLRGLQSFYGFDQSTGFALHWSVKEGSAGGAISPSGDYTGTYTAPMTPGTYHVVGTGTGSQASQAEAVVTVVGTGVLPNPTGLMNSARGGFAATLLAGGPASTNGKVLVTGGNSEPASNTVPVRGINGAQLFDAATGTFVVTGSMTAPRYAHTATLLPNGKVLVAGGLGDGAGSAPPVLDSAELYDPATGTFTRTGSMLVPRAKHTATLISAGRVLIAGGTPYSSARGQYPYGNDADSVSIAATAEIYDVATGTFTTVATMSTGRFGHTATLLADGTVLVAGGVYAHDLLGGKGINTASAEIYDPATGSFTSVGSMRFERDLHTATLLDDGKVLVAGGSWAGASAELFDPQAKTFSDTGSMKSLRSAQTATKLVDGSILLAGGALAGECVEESQSSCQPVASLEVFDPASGTFAPIGFMNVARWAHTATLLDSGAVLLVGGEGEVTAELYP